MEEFLAEHIWSMIHWPFMAASIIYMMVGQVVKNTVFTKGRAITSKPRWLWWWGRKLLPLHPVTAGFITGLFWKNPEGADPAWGTMASMFYFGMAGALSVWLYEILKQVAKKKGIKLGSLPGQSDAPPSTDPLPGEKTPVEKPPKSDPPKPRAK